MSEASANNPVPTLSALMENANARWRVFDMGRKITGLSKADFAAIETNSKPYPFPIQQKARFALVFWDQSESKLDAKANPFIWFLQFDLDEMGLLKLQQRDHYISLVIKELGSRLVEQDNEQQSVLDNHPYSFTPDQNRQAAFNARVKVALKQPASMYYEHAQAYFNGQVDADKWQELTVQGIADFAARIHQAENEQALIKALPELPVQTTSVLAACLEHSEIGIGLTQALIELQDQYLEDGDNEQVLNLLRCLAGSKSKALISEQLSKLLSSKEAEEESLFIVTAGRFWPYLQDKALLHLYFEQAAKHSNQQLFGGLFGDLVALPDVRQQVLGLLRDPTRPEAVSRAIGAVFGRA
mgnify:CR=1 FL=1